MTKDKALTGAAGEYYVAFRLSAEGYAVGLTTRGTRAIDMIVANPDTGKSITIQTKTMLNAFVRRKKRGPFWKWRVGTRPPPASETLFYAFVDLRNEPSQPPDVFIVPSVQLPPLLEVYPEPEKGPAKDVWCTISEKDQGNYLNRWDFIRDALA
jgi:hypothetical protein